MPTAKVTFFYEYGTYGWSESLWHPYTSDLIECSTDAEAYGQARMKISGSGVYLQAIRFSDDIVYRDSKYDPKSYFASNPGQPNPSSPNEGAVVIVAPPAGLDPQPVANPYDAVQVRMEGGSLYRREMMVRGLPQNIMSPNFGPVIQGVYAQAFTAWSNLFKTTWQFRAKNRSGGNSLVPVVGVVPAVGNLPAGVLCANPTVAAGNYVQLLGFRNYQGVRGKYYVQSVAAPGGIGGAFSVVYLIGFTSIQITNANGYIQLLSTAGGTPQPSYQSITAVRVIGQTHRKTGRPFEGPRGRSRARV